MARRQCAKCPWKTSTDPFDIPGGYCSTKHAALTSTIAEPGVVTDSDALNMMACHETTGGDEEPCVGWLYQQLGAGNNLQLRLAGIRGQVNTDIEIVGAQHPDLEATLPPQATPTPRTHD